MSLSSFSKAKILSTVLIIIVIALCVIWGVRNRVASGQKIRNVVLISIDTCRADYLSCYGYPHRTTPNIDAIAAKGIVFENVYSPVPLTLPAHS
ncbi:MAG: sulfatase-like hydrolase/transferase, partial [Anaerohalosphaera sp.]|nr:sulfatase-like hydrolase/transferase [Anaerohalosphaera sp.]